MPTEKPTLQKLTLSDLATARPSENLRSEQPVQVSTNIVALDVQQPVAPEDAPPVPRLKDKKILPSQSNSLKMLESTTNASNEIFRPGDKIRVKAPWGDIAIAEIVTLYQDLAGNNWAYYVPFEPLLPPDWGWLGGCIQASLLVKSI